jgi:hypothetical protein
MIEPSPEAYLEFSPKASDTEQVALCATHVPKNLGGVERGPKASNATVGSPCFIPRPADWGGNTCVRGQSWRLAVRGQARKEHSDDAQDSKR